jgi:cyclopropane fatty-acyl-phospholipid synthase-like methyltransferase
MDGSDIELFPFLPYILQDVWEIGASPHVMIQLVRKHAKIHSRLRVLDLGCGKGAVSIQIAKEFKCQCLGIDAIRDFISEADAKAREFAVADLCRFAVGDIREKVKTLPRFDIIILGAIGPVFGDYLSTLTALHGCLTLGGMVIIDDGYIEDDSDYVHPLVRKRGEILRKVRDAGMEIIDEVIFQGDEIKDADEQVFRKLKKRCRELIAAHPEKSRLFENYIRKQEEENDVLETKIVCSTMVIGNCGGCR